MNLEIPTTSAEADKDTALLTPAQVDDILMTGAELDTVEPIKVMPTDEEIAEGVTSVECAGISTYALHNRPEERSRLSDDFQGAVVRLQHHPDGDRSRLEVTTDVRNSGLDGKHISENHQEVYEFDNDGRVVKGFGRVVKTYASFEDHPKGDRASEVVVGDPIEGDELVAKATARVKDVQTCVSAGI
jgi:hypothetical protein